MAWRLARAISWAQVKRNAGQAVSIDQVRQLALSVRNWGRWGPDDEIGTLNYITAESIAAACRLATSGKVFKRAPGAGLSSRPLARTRKQRDRALLR